MNINRNNCEAWFLDFYEGNLSDGQVKELFAFLEQNPEMRELFESFEDVSFDPEKHISFEGKDALKKTVLASPGISESNYEEYLVGALEGILSAAEQKELDLFLAAHPGKQAELVLLRKTIFEPDAEIVFEGKEALKKSLLVTEANFEEYAVAYIDGELSGEALQAFEAFVAAHPTMKEELSLFSATKLQPDASVVFEDKASLKRKALVVTAENFDEVAVASIEDQLNAVEEKVFAAYLAANPSAEKSFGLYRQTRLQPDTSVVFADKESLKRKDRGGFWWNSTGMRYAAAAAVLLFIAIYFYNRSGENPKDPSHSIANNLPATSNHRQLPFQPSVHDSSSPVIAAGSNNDNLLAQHTPVTAYPDMHPVKEQQSSISVAVNYLDRPQHEEDIPQFSGYWFDNFDGVRPAMEDPGSPKAITPGQFAMRWMKDRLDRRSELGDEDEEDMVASASTAGNENQDVSGFDLTSSAVNRIGQATGSHLHLSRQTEGAVLTIGKYDILLSRNR
jgi:anti-sigma factor RsiW